MKGQFTTFWDIDGEQVRCLVDQDKKEFRRARFLEQLHVPYRPSVFGLQWFERLGLAYNENLRLTHVTNLL